MSNYRVSYILDIMVLTIRYKRMLKDVLKWRPEAKAAR